MDYQAKNARKLTIPIEPEMNVPQRVSCGVMGTQINLVDRLDEKYLEGKNKFKENEADIEAGRPSEAFAERRRI